MPRKIMIIDDDRAVRDFLFQALEAAGFYVETLSHAAAGLRHLLTEHFDLALIDMDLPEINGPNVCRALRKHEQTRHLPVIMICSERPDKDDVDEIVTQYGVNDFLWQPVTGEALQRLIERFIDAEKNTSNDTSPGFRPLSEYTLPFQLHRLYRENATGLLHLHSGDAKKIIYLKEGYPVFARSNLLSECLGRMLVREGLITQVDCDESVERSRTSGRLQGMVLIEMGLLTPQELQAALNRQVTEKLLSCFSWRTGSWEFSPVKDFKAKVTRIKLSPASLILRGIDAHWPPRRLNEYLYPFGRDYLLPAQHPRYRFQDIELSKRGEAIFKCCQGTKTLDEILKQHPLARREAQKVVAALLISELLVRRTEPLDAGFEEDSATSTADIIDDKLRRKILQDYQRIMAADYFSALGIRPDSPTAEIRKAYYRLAKEYHPDRFLGSGLSAEMNAKINEMFQHITQAYTVLSRPDSFNDYLASLKGDRRDAIDINQIIEAENAYQQGQALLKVKRFLPAAKILRKAVELSPQEPEYMTAFAWALFKTAAEDPDKQTQALEILLSSREINPDQDLTHLYLGHIYQIQGKERQAEKSFEQAVLANPDCTEALRELRLINLRREQVQQTKGFFNKLKKK